MGKGKYSLDVVHLGVTVVNAFVGAMEDDIEVFCLVPVAVRARDSQGRVVVAKNWIFWSPIRTRG